MITSCSPISYVHYKTAKVSDSDSLSHFLRQNVSTACRDSSQSQLLAPFMSPQELGYSDGGESLLLFGRAVWIGFAKHIPDGDPFTCGLITEARCSQNASYLASSSLQTAGSRNFSSIGFSKACARVNIEQSRSIVRGWFEIRVPSPGGSSQSDAPPPFWKEVAARLDLVWSVVLSGFEEVDAAFQELYSSIVYSIEISVSDLLILRSFKVSGNISAAHGRITHGHHIAALRVSMSIEYFREFERLR